MRDRFRRRNKFTRPSIVLLYAFIFLLAGISHAGILHVSPTGTDNGGLTWEDAFTTIAAAIEAATDGDEIRVEGLKDHLYTSGYAIPIDRNLSIVGGYIGNGDLGRSDERDLLNLPTKINGIETSDEAVTSLLLDGLVIDCRSAGLLVNVTTASSIVIKNCIIQNTFTGIRHNRGGSLTLTNCLIRGNMAGQYPIPEFPDGIPGTGGAIYFRGRKLTLVNCTLCRNTAYQGVHGIDYVGEEPCEITNCIIYDDSDLFPTPEVNYTNIWGNTIRDLTGTGNMYLDPRVIDRLSEHHLAANSPCIDAGTRTALTHDLEGLPRPVDIPGVGHAGADAVDMGCYEYQLPATPTATATPTLVSTATPTRTETPFTPTATRTPRPTVTANPRADINQDGQVNSTDLQLLMTDWHQAVPTPAR